LFKDVLFGLVRFFGLHETGRFFIEMDTEYFVRRERSESKTSVLGCDWIEIRRSIRRSRRPQKKLDVLTSKRKKSVSHLDKKSKFFLKKNRLG